ncbi:MAG: branched-chain amino acid ABC transporter permease [Burkholderiales bacterium]|nr:branched-chain amino acid ABC transporter permease [Burkholderiales bacterium]OUT79248.1 MAG: branched-chain amino acid ABC transporter permease [Betaproteobacteria bacterium TMED22]|tara:strand:- start:11828 stop:13045 length:1218 start_codon:yes stop_codon:yes gene_type:complete
MSDALTKARLLLWGGAAFLFLLLPLVFSGGFSLSMLSQMGIMVIFALSYNMLLGQTGLLSFGHAVYFGLAAFVTAHAINFVEVGALGLPISLMPLVGGMTGLFFSLILGFVTTRRPGTPFAMISLGIAEMVAASALMFTTFFGGEGGIVTNRTAGGVNWGISYGPQIQVYYLIAVWCFVSMVLMFAITRTPLGRIANAVRDNPERAQFVGYNPTRVRWIMMSLAGFFAGIAGALATINYEIITAEALGLMASGNVVLMAFIGGIGQFWGPIIGAVLVTWLQSALSNFTQAWLLYFGLLFLLIILFSPGGISNLVTIHLPAWRAGVVKRLMPSYGYALLTGGLTLIGVIGVIELLYRGALFVGVHAVIPWIASGLMILIGGFFLRRAIRAVRQVWDDLSPELARWS